MGFIGQVTNKQVSEGFGSSRASAGCNHVRSLHLLRRVIAPRSVVSGVTSID